MNERYGNLHRLTEAEGELNFHLHVFGDYLAKREGYRSHDGIEAVHYYLCIKFAWTPATVRAMNPNDIRFLLEEEFHGWTAPPEARF